jgi:hypothetical protein
MRAYQKKSEKKNVAFIGVTHGIGCSLVIVMDEW